MTEQKALFWIFVAIFTVTAVITLLGITGVLKNIKEKYLNALFTALILEVIAAVIVVFRGFDFNSTPVNNGPDLSQIISKAGLASSLSPEEDKENFILTQMKAGLELPQLKKQLDSLVQVLKTKEEALQQLQSEYDELDKSFYSKIIRLRQHIHQYDGFVNIAFQENEKEEVYVLLASILETLGRATNDSPVYQDEARTQVNKAAVKKTYIAFREEYGKLTESKDYIYVTEYDTIQMIHAYLKILQGRE
ncbi:MAG TPA: hypothetical protein PKA00_18525 [Saprospiraceae bacterium]|nr:hypothetical protein [Saprospiraceae bacterium]HMQ84915.1 hypothetical protein [Saprospiraceae bacterium]